TGVQTCALPISPRRRHRMENGSSGRRTSRRSHAPDPTAAGLRPENAPEGATLAASRPTGRGVASWKERVTMDWRHRAECLNHDPELFFPIGNTGQIGRAHV